jgi:hypothetical protein
MLRVAYAARRSHTRPRISSSLATGAPRSSPGVHEDDAPGRLGPRDRVRIAAAPPAGAAGARSQPARALISPCICVDAVEPHMLGCGQIAALTDVAKSRQSQIETLTDVVKLRHSPMWSNRGITDVVISRHRRCGQIAALADVVKSRHSPPGPPGGGSRVGEEERVPSQVHDLQHPQLPQNGYAEGGEGGVRRVQAGAGEGVRRQAR